MASQADLDQSPDSNPNSSTEPVILEPQGKHTRTAIMLHGRGSTGLEFSSELFETRFSSGETLRELLPGYRFVFPRALDRHSVRFKEILPQWYDIWSLDDTEMMVELQIDGLRESVEQVREMVARGAALSPTGDVVLGGISQGFTIALLAVLTGLKGVKALVGFSSWLPLKSVVEGCIEEGQIKGWDGKEIRMAVSQALSTRLGISKGDSLQEQVPPVFLGHCTDDEIVDVGLGQGIRDILQKLEYDVDWRESPNGGHWINEPHGMNGLKSFLWKNDLVNSRL